MNDKKAVSTTSQTADKNIKMTPVILVTKYSNC